MLRHFDNVRNGEIIYVSFEIALTFEYAGENSDSYLVSFTRFDDENVLLSFEDDFAEHHSKHTGNLCSFEFYLNGEKLFHLNDYVPPFVNLNGAVIVVYDSIIEVEASSEEDE